MGKRDTAILDILGMTGRMEVVELAERVGVSQVTLRKDLDDLEARGLVRREHGVARLFSPSDVAGRLALHYDVKLRIARAAASLVRDGETVMVENGSSCALLARELASERRDVTVVTNSAFIAGYVRELPGARTVLLGGDYQNDSQVVVGPLVAETAAGFHVRQLFVGADGWTPEAGFTNADHLRARAVRAMATCAERVVVLTDSSKFGTRGVVSLSLDPARTTVVTDDALPDDSRAALKATGAQLVVA